MLGLFAFLPTNRCSIEPLKVKLLAGEQKATERRDQIRWCCFRSSTDMTQVFPYISPFGWFEHHLLSLLLG